MNILTVFIASYLLAVATYGHIINRISNDNLLQSYEGKYVMKLSCLSWIDGTPQSGGYLVRGQVDTNVSMNGEGLTGVSRTDYRGMWNE